MAVAMECSKCLSLLTSREIDKKDYSLALADIAVTGDVNAVRTLLDHGADVNIVDSLGRTPLMYAAASDNLPLEVVETLVEHGADVNAKDAHKLGADSVWTALDIARQHGDTPIVAFLLKSGAKSNAAPPPQLNPRRSPPPLLALCECGAEKEGPPPPPPGGPPPPHPPPREAREVSPPTKKGA